MRQEQELWRSDMVRALSSILDFPGHPEEREEKLIVAYAGYMESSSHVHRLPYGNFKNTVNRAFKEHNSARTDVRVFMKDTLGIDVNGMEMPFCTICEKLGDSEGVLCCEALPRGVSSAFSGCGYFKAKTGMEEIARRWLNLA